jgi:hypothetical protein
MSAPFGGRKAPARDEQVLTRVSPDVLSPLGMTMAPWKILRNVTGVSNNLNANAPF